MPPEPSERTGPNQRANEPGANRSPVRLLTYTDAARLLGLRPDAVRMRCRRGKLVCGQGPDGAGVVWPQPEPANARTDVEPGERAANGSVRLGGSGTPTRPQDRPRDVEPAVLAERVDRLEQHLADARQDRDRWHAEAQQAAARAAAALAAREDAKRELRVLLARATAPALPSGQTTLESPTAAPAPPESPSPPASGGGLLARLRRLLGG